jgi:acetyltransferase
MQELPANMLSRFTLIDYDREMALVALITEESTNLEGQTIASTRIVGVSRYITNPDRATCEFSLVVADEFKGRGLGSRLMLSIMDFAREKGLTDIEGLVLANNPNMLKLMKGLGFTIKPFPEDPDFKLVTHHLQVA